MRVDACPLGELDSLDHVKSNVRVRFINQGNVLRYGEAGNKLFLARDRLKNHIGAPKDLRGFFGPKFRGFDHANFQP